MDKFIFALLLIKYYMFGVVGQEYMPEYFAYADEYDDIYRDPRLMFKTESDFCKRKSKCFVPGSDTYVTSYPDKSCYCDEVCSINNDCCNDFSPSIQQFIRPSQLSCLSDEEIMQNTMFGYMMVDKCNSDVVVSELSVRCENSVDEEDISLKLPVTSNITQVVYKNMYCAFCNDEFDLLHWYLQVSCVNNVTTFLPENITNCDILFWPPKELQNARKCPNRIVVDSCPDNFGVNSTEKEIEGNCTHNRVEYVYGKTTMYKNKYCALCSGVDEDEIYCEQQEFDLIPITPTIQPRYSFRVLIDFNSKEAEHQGKPPVKLPVSCQDDELFDPYTNNCRTIFCMPPRFASNGRCILLDNSSLSNIRNVSNSNCTFVKYTPSEYRIVNETAVFIIPLDRVYNMSEAYIRDANVFICANENQTCREDCTMRQPMFDFDNTEQLLSNIVLIISLVSLALTFTVYVSFPVLLNLPGKILICLIVSLFFAKLNFLFAEFAESSHSACVIVAIAIHFFYLSSFCWLNIVALDLWMTFSKQFISAGSESESSRRLYIYSLYGWGCPFLITLCAIIVDHTKIDDRFNNLKPQYGRYSCWIGNRDALLLFFVGPIALSQVFNLVSFVFTSCHIARANRHGAMARGQNKTCTLLIIFKLSLIMGLTWLFAVLASTFTDSVMWYIFIILNGLQGFYICICFVCTKKVTRLLKEKAAEISTTRSNSTQMTSMDKSNAKKESA